MIAEQEAEALSIDGARLDETEMAAGPELVLPDGVDQGELLDALWRDLRRGEHAKSVLAEAQMRRVIAASQTLGEPGFVDGLGQLVARIPAAVYHHWGQRYGYAVWNDPMDLIRHLERLNPGFLIKSRSQKTQVCVDGLRGDFPAPRAPVGVIGAPGVPAAPGVASAAA